MELKWSVGTVTRLEATFTTLSKKVPTHYWALLAQNRGRCIDALRPFWGR